MVQFEIDQKIDWKTLHEILKAKYESKELIIKYIDDENEEIDINSQSEFENAYALASLTNTPLKFVIKKRDGKKIDEAIINIKPKIKLEENLINLDTMLTTTPLIESKINGLSEIVAQAVNETEFKTNEQPLWFTNAMKTLKIEILNEVRDLYVKPIYEKFEAEKQISKQTIVNELSIEKIENLIAELEEAKLLDDMIRAKEIEEKINGLNAFNAKFVRDCNVPDGTKFEINTKFKKSWLLQNKGRLAWLESKIKLVNIGGNINCETKNVNIPFTDVYDLVEIEVNLIAPDKAGIYLSEWILAYENFLFGPRIWCAIEVIDNSTVNKLISVDVHQTEILSTKEPKAELSTQLVPISPIIVTTNRKFSTSTEIDEKQRNSVESSFDHTLSDDENEENEFVIIPDCLNLAKKWEPKKESGDLSVDFDCEIVKQSPCESNTDQVNSTSTMMLVNELLLIPKYERQTIVEAKRFAPLKISENLNLMTFSSSLHDETSESIENIKFDSENSCLNDTVKDEKDLLIFSDDYSNLNKIKNQDEPAKVEKLSEISAKKVLYLPTVNQSIASSTTIQLASPSAPSLSFSSQYSSLDNSERLISMGFANRSLNKKLLNKHNDDINKVIEELLRKNDNDWASNRH